MSLVTDWNAYLRAAPIGVKLFAAYFAALATLFFWVALRMPGSSTTFWVLGNIWLFLSVTGLRRSGWSFLAATAVCALLLAIMIPTVIFGLIGPWSRSSRHGLEDAVVVAPPLALFLILALVWQHTRQLNWHILGHGPRAPERLAETFE